MDSTLDQVCQRAQPVGLPARAGLDQECEGPFLDIREFMEKSQLADYEGCTR